MTAARAWLWATILLTTGALASAVALAPPPGAPPVRALSWLLFTGSSVHVASTGWLFTVPAVRAYAREHAARCLWVPVSLVVIAAIAAAAIRPAAFGWLLLPYFGWQFFHYQKQNLGMASLAASAQRVRPLLPAERGPLLLAGVSAIVALAARPGLLGLRLASPSPVLFPLAGAAFAVAVAAGLAALARRPAPQRPAAFCVTYLTCLFFSLPAFVFSSPYAAVGGMTIAHGLQYLLLVALIAGGSAPAARTRSSRLVRLSLLANIALIGGAALSSASHLHDAGWPGRCVFGAYLGVVMAHFAIDAGLWRMRDPLARNFLTTHLPYLVPGTVAAPAPALALAPSTDRSSADI
jgi:hypothetical protein